MTSSIPFILGMATLALIFLIVAARYWLIRKEYLKTLVDYSSLTLLVNSISDMILVCDIETERIQLFNSAGCARTGYTQQEIHRLMLSDVMIHRPRSSSTASTSQSRHDVDEGGMILPAVLRDEHVPNELGLHDMDESEAGRKLHHSTNIEQIINNVAEVTTGAPPVDLSPSARANLSFSVDTKKTDDEVLIPIEEHESALRTVEVRMKNGDTFRAEANISKFNVKNGDTPGSATSKAMAVIVLRNMTAHIEVRKALRKAKNEAEVANKQKSLFLAFICHELRNPLHGIVGLNEMLMKTATAEQQESCASISECAKLMNVIVDDVLDLSKIQVGKNRLESIQFSMSALFTDLELWIRNLVNPNVVLSMDTPWTGDSGSDLLVFGDPTRLRQILLNLMSNAAKFTIEGDINIICKVIQEEKEFVRCHIEVVDTGEGIAEIDVATLFISYVQANSSVRRKHGGTGLGLCIARGLLQQMKSDICVESKLGEGSRFWFDITFSKARDGQEPAAAARAEVVRIHTDHGTNHYTAKQDDQKTTTSSTSTDDIELTPMKQPKQQSPGGAVQTLPKRSKKTKRKVKLPKSLQDFGNTHQILIVDDVVVNQRIMQSMVNQLGVSHCTAGDGQHALDILDENYSACQLSDEKSVLPIGLVLTDINMPFMDGKQLILAMRGDDKLAEIPVVVFTGNAMPSDIAELYELGSDGVVTKPFKVNNLVSAVEQAVNNRQKLQL